MSGYCGFEHVDGEGQGYYCPACGAIRNPGFTAVRPGNRIHEGKSETVTGRMFSLYKSFENFAADISWESRTVVFNHQQR